ncbi:MAG: hypothetical protein RIB43_12465 [Rhodospirillaceae bacterium]
MRTSLLLLPLLWAVFASAPVVSKDIERSALFSMSQGDVLEDAGVFTVMGRSTRTEVFETVRHPDGGWTTTSIITNADQPYRVEGRWRYDADGRSSAARGIGAYDGVPVDVAITVDRPSAVITVDVGAGDLGTVGMGKETRSINATCGATCFVDLSPSVMAMFALTRQFDPTTTDTRRYQWIGQALHADFSLLEGGGSDVHVHAVHAYEDTQVLQFVFDESLPGDAPDETVRASFNLYVDSNYRPLAFISSGGTVGHRAGYEFITSVFPPSFEK